MKWYRYLPYIWTWPVDLILWLVWILPFYALWGRDLRFEEGSLVFNLKKSSWPARTWYARWGGTSIGHAIMYGHRIPWSTEPWESDKLHRTRVHEQHHVKQYESVTLGAFLFAWIPWAFLTASGDQGLAWACFLVMWLTATVQHSIGGWLAAGIRGQRVYRDSYHEQSAYAVDYKYQTTGKRDT